MDTFEGLRSRRDFLKGLGQSLASVAVVGFVAPVIISCSSATGPGSSVASFNMTIDVSSLTQSNTAVRTTTPDGYSLLVVRQSASTYITLLMVCPHQNCGGTSMIQSQGNILCTCHGSTFSMNGTVMMGPAQTNLVTYSTVYDPTTKKVTVHN